MSAVPIELMKVQIFAIPQGFVLGEGVLGESLLGGSLVGSWRDILCDAQQVSISRGGQPTGVTNSLDVGTMSIQLYNSANPFNDPGVKPGVKIRVLVKTGAAWTTTTPMFTGTVEDVYTKYDKEGDVRVVIKAADAVRPIKSTMRYGVDSGGFAEGMEYWETRIARLIQSLDDEIETIGAPGPWPSRQVLVDPAVKPAADWSRFGTRPGGMAGDGFIISSAGLEVRTLPQAPSTNVIYKPLEFGIQRLVTGLTVGRTYSITASMLYGGENVTTPDEFRTYSIGAYGVGWGESQPVRETRSGVLYNAFRLRYDFVATSSSVYVVIARDYDGSSSSVAPDNAATWLAETFFLESFGVIGFLETPVTDVVYESSLLNHFQMACNSVGAYWWVNRDNEVIFSKTLPASIVAKFSDVHDTADLLHVCFLDVEMGYDTRNVVNTLTIQNHGRRDDPRVPMNTNFLALDSEGTFVDTVSRTVQGARADIIDLSIPVSRMSRRADEILVDSSSPQVAVQTITFSALAHPTIAALDLYSRVMVKVRNHLAAYLVVGIEHSGDPESWTTTFTLRKD